jgi:choline dehydrogenase
VEADSEVASVVVDAGRATGVELADGRVVRGHRVVLCAGTYGSPTILMRSGIGPAGHLREVGVEVRVDLPGVGSNLADHPGCDVDPGLRGEADVGPRLFSLATFHSTRTPTTDAPDLALWVYDPFGDPGEPSQTEVSAIVLTPRSRGSVRLRSADPLAKPRITLPGLRDADDVERMSEAVERAFDVAADPAVRRLCAKPAKLRPGDARALREMVRREAWSYPHTVGTCAMGPHPQQGAVVDTRGSVHGIDGLTVADASVIPFSPSGFPHLISMMVAARIGAGLAEG